MVPRTHQNLTEVDGMPADAQKVDGRPLGHAEGSRKASQPHRKLRDSVAVARKVVEGPSATLKVNGESRRHTECQLKLTEGPAAAKNIDRSVHERAES